MASELYRECIVFFSLGGTLSSNLICITKLSSAFNHRDDDGTLESYINGGVRSYGGGVGLCWRPPATVARLGTSTSLVIFRPANAVARRLLCVMNRIIELYYGLCSKLSGGSEIDERLQYLPVFYERYSHAFSIRFCHAFDHFRCAMHANKI